MAAKRRKFTPQFKAQTVLEFITGQTHLANICQKYGLNHQIVARWKAEFLAKAPQIFQENQEVKAYQQRIADLERMVGKLTMEIDILKKASNLLISL
jgi:transposase-like protein